MSRTTITIGVVMVLCAAAIAYSQGWFKLPRSNDASEGNNFRSEQRIDQEQGNDVAVRLTKETVTPADTVTK